LVLKSKNVCDGDCRGGIQRVMPAWHRQSEVADRVRDFHSTIAEENRKPRLTVEMVEIGEPYVSLWVFAVSEDAPIFQLADQGLHHRMICAHNREAIEWHVLDESAECILHGVKRLEMVEMLRIDVGDDGDVSRQFQKRAVRFIGFDHHPITSAKPRVGAIRIDNATIDHGWVEVTGFKKRRNKRSRGRLAMSARDRNAA